MVYPDLWMDISGIDLALLFHLIVISLSFILMSLIALLITLFSLVVSEKNLSIMF
jgi:hypothetical protein